MSFKELFSRSKERDVATRDQIICDTEELKDFISLWTINEGWEFEDFADFMELIGIKTPVKLSQYDKEKYSFQCVTALNTKMGISLVFGDGIDYCSEIRVTEGEEKRCYFINTNDVGQKKSAPKATLQSRNIKRNGKELESYYSEYHCHRILKLDKTHELEVEIDKPETYQDQSEFFVLQNCTDIEEYLLGLEAPLNATEVYQKMMEFLSFSEEDILKCDKILVSYLETIDDRQLLRSRILLTNGKMQEYAILEEGETYHVFKDGNWVYTSDRGIRIMYLEDRKRYTFSVAGSEEEIIAANPSKTMNKVKTKIAELWKYVK